MATSNTGVPPHLREFPGVFVRDGDGRVVDAPQADQEVAMGYPAWSTKGALKNGRRLTIMTAASRYAVGDEVRVIHVVETLSTKDELYVMGPKSVLGEYVDGSLRTAEPAKGQDPLGPPMIYDGPVLSGPAVDYNYEITSYRFLSPETHKIVWKLGELRSNQLVIEVE
ncbi:MAG: hypothetical protein MJE77_11645 [Proteobacteria bacterium]|nr:hypothetical protein [Pseudomonadota bacterium]